MSAPFYALRSSLHALRSTLFAFRSTHPASRIPTPASRISHRCFEQAAQADANAVGFIVNDAKRILVKPAANRDEFEDAQLPSTLADDAWIVLES